MRKFLFGLILGAILTIGAIVIVALAAGKLFSGKQATVQGNSALVLSLEGDVPEAAPVEVSLPFFQSQSSPTVRDLWSSLHEAAADGRIKAVVLQPRGLAIGWGKLQEIREQISDFKKSGKPVYAFLQAPGSRELYLGSVADKIYVSPDDMLDVKGFRIEEMFFKGTLDKLGVGVQVDHIGRYKDAGDMFTRTEPTPETQEVLNQVLDQLYGDFCTTVGQGRRKSADQVRTLVDGGPYMAGNAKSVGLIDELGYEDQVYGDLKKKLGLGELHKQSIKSYFRAVPGRGDHIALLVGSGDIVSGGGGDSLGSQDVIATEAFTKIVRQVKNDSSVKGVILRIDSPGGDAVASDEMLHELKLLSNTKPLVVSMSDVAASGGYFMASTGDPIVSYPDTITGSIGVLYVRPNLHGLYDKLGIQESILSRGSLASMDSVYLPLSDAARQKLHESIEITYRSFVGKVAAARKKNYDQIETLAQGRVWMGTQARQNGLVDELGGLNRAVALVRQKAKLGGGETNLIVYPPRRSLLDVIVNPSTDDYAQSVAETKLRKLVPGLPGPAILRGGIVSILPYRIQVQ